MKLKIEYVDGGIQEVVGDYEVHENYIRIEYNSGGYTELIIPLCTVLYLEATI